MAAPNQFDLDTAEKITLITENRRVQICFPYPFPKPAWCYIVHHDTASTAAICRAELHDFQCAMTARDMISSINRIQPAQ